MQGNWQQIISQKIKQQTWQRWKDAYQKKFKKKWDESIFTVLASITIFDSSNQSHKIISVGFGTKSLSKATLQEHDRESLIQDMHAEMMAIRAFRKFVLNQISHKESKYFEWSSIKNKHRLRSNFQVILYCSEPFCGDCCINQQNQSFSGAKPLRYFQNQKYPDQKYQEGILRTKPGRIDLPLHKRSPILSCSDLLAFYNLVGIQGQKLFGLVFPIYLNMIIVECEPQLKLNVVKGIDYVERLSRILNRSKELVERQILNIIVSGKQRKISSQFIKNIPSINVIAKNGGKKSRDQEGFQLCGILTGQVQEWISGKTGLPEGTSLKTYKEKGKLSKFSEKSLSSCYSEYRQNKNCFKYDAIEYSLKKLFGEWIDSIVNDKDNQNV